MKVLVLAYDYPPVKRIGAQRPASWVKYIDNQTFEVTVIAGPWKSDPSSSQIIYAPKRFSIREKWLSGNNTFLSLLRKPLSLLRLTGGFFSLKLDDKRAIYQKAEEQIVASKPDVIIATGEPFILFRYANKLSKKYDIPWIADYRDPWSSEQSVRNKSSIFAFLNDYFFRHIEKSLVRTAAAITTPSEPYKNLIQKVVPGVDIHIIPNGFDLPAGFKRRSPSKEKLTFCYLGRLYPHRKFQIFLDGLSNFIKSSGKNEIEVRFYGLKSYPEQMEKVSEYKKELRPYLKFYDLIPYEEVMGLAQDAHLCLMFSDGKSNFSPGKLYDYIGLNRKIWLSPKDGGFLASIINSKNLGKVMNAVSEIELAIKDAYTEYKNDNVDAFLNPSINDFSRKQAALKMQNLLESVFEKPLKQEPCVE